MTNIKDTITDSRILAERQILRDGFYFSAITHPANVYDAIIIRFPADAKCASFRAGVSPHSLNEYIEFVKENEIEKAIIIAEKIDFITLCPSLKYLCIIPAENTRNGFDYSPLYQMPQIKSLQCTTVYGKRDEFSAVIDCEKIKGLEDIHIINQGYKNFEKVGTLKGLGLTNYKKQDLSEAFSSKMIDTLLICQSKIISLEGIQKSQKMQCVYLYNNRTLQDIGALEKVQKTLKALRIENCPQIKDFSVLGKLRNVELLELTGSNEIPNLSFINKMEKLKTFIFNMNVRDGDLTPCLNLSYVYSEKDRKNYNLKNTNLPKGQYVHGNETIDEWRKLE